MATRTARRTAASTPRKPAAPSATARALKEKAKEAIWELYIEYCLGNDCDTNCDADALDTLVSDVLGCSDNNSTITTKLGDLRLLTIKTAVYSLELSSSGRRKVLDDLDNHCFSEADKKNIRKALGADKDGAWRR
jgi:hypothetical protein